MLSAKLAASDKSYKAVQVKLKFWKEQLARADTEKAASDQLPTLVNDESEQGMVRLNAVSVVHIRAEKSTSLLVTKSVAAFDAVAR